MVPPQVPEPGSVPVTVAALVVPPVVTQAPPGVNVMAFPQRSFPGWENESMGNTRNKKQQATVNKHRIVMKGGWFFIKRY